MSQVVVAVGILCGITDVSLAETAPADQPLAGLIRSVRSGAWSALATWHGGQVPTAGARVQVCSGHTVTYDIDSNEAIRFLHIAGTLAFAPDKDTCLSVGLIKIQPGDQASEDGFDCDVHLPASETGKTKPALEVGSPDRPIDAKHTAVIRLVHFEGTDRDSWPAIVCCGGRMDFHGAPMNRTWVKLGATAKAKESEITLAEPVTGWRVGDRVILTATTRQNKRKKTFREHVTDQTATEERTIKALDGVRLTLDKPLAFEHLAEGAYRGEVANLSRNVIVESADPGRDRGHTMYHRNSAGSIRYAEFRHLGKEGVLGRYSLHYHLAGDTMRGSSVIGASIWDSGNRWLTIHGTNYLVVRDCVGYRSLGHGFFFEDGTEVYNVLDRNLAVQALTAKPLPNQVLPFDKNDGSGFWWSNSLNTFMRNTACECDEYGYFFQAAKTAAFDPTLAVQQPDGSKRPVDVRTLPFIRFEDNEAHCQRRHAFNLGGGVPFGKPNVDGVGPDSRHPFVIRNMRIWNSHWAFHPVAPAVLVDNMDIHDTEYGVWRPVYRQHAYRHLNMDKVEVHREFAPEGTAPKEAEFPKPLDPVDDLPPATVITRVEHPAAGKLIVRGTTSDNGTVREVQVNGERARALAPNYAEWEVVFEGLQPGEMKLAAHATDAAGNVEKRPHTVAVLVR
jgi:hypothetical protein